LLAFVSISKADFFSFVLVANTVDAVIKTAANNPIDFFIIFSVFICLTMQKCNLNKPEKIN
jgi:hypothetical protein